MLLLRSRVSESFPSRTVSERVLMLIKEQLLNVALTVNSRDYCERSKIKDVKLVWHDLSNDVTFRLVCSESRTVVSAAAAVDMVDTKEKITSEIFMKAVILSLVYFMILDV